jgi:hypothetical protein
MPKGASALLKPGTAKAPPFRGGTAGISIVFFACFSKARVEKKHRNSEEPPFAVHGAGATLEMSKSILKMRAILCRQVDAGG